jgi:hypothetical protein
MEIGQRPPLHILKALLNAELLQPCNIDAPRGVDVTETLYPNTIILFTGTGAVVFGGFPLPGSVGDHVLAGTVGECYKVKVIYDRNTSGIVGIKFVKGVVEPS